MSYRGHPMNMILLKQDDIWRLHFDGALYWLSKYYGSGTVNRRFRNEKLARAVYSWKVRGAGSLPKEFRE